MLDPLVLKLLSSCFGLLFLLAAVHKLTGLATFRSTLAAYGLLPAALVPPLGMLVPMIEATLGVLWLLTAAQLPVALASVALLSAYTLAIVINILRGRVHIDCGCGMARTAGRDQHLSWSLVVRNLILIVAALLAGLPATDRAVGLLDYVTLIAGLLAVALLYGAANQLLNNAAAIGMWRKRHD